ncbi:MAG: nucleoside diphosphate kinase [Candidatus Parvarchaeum acidophilus ARMAN-5]|uniref:Nucleoside diphosphate kinase n=1 Tax=Candidatus Parvarchaeum acidophilus ARMAN-5 TaxID=662762 RepID=D6GUZ1_PARA5|nr:MAG: nucleoside diphosphate kinase [Candidatus Parvarchaeum acidophilus ARMAN-5]
MEEMLILLKPDGMVRRYSGARALKSILELNPEIKFFEIIKPDKDFLAEKHYGEHKGKFCYDNLINFMSYTELAVIIAAGDNITEKVRNLLGKTMCEKADPLSIRGRYGTTKGINLVHASDSKETAEKETTLWKSIIKIETSKNYLEEMKKYISKYENFPMIDSVRYREISKALTDKEIEKGDAEKILKELLMRETDFEEDKVKELPALITENILLG